MATKSLRKMAPEDLFYRARNYEARVEHDDPIKMFICKSNFAFKSHGAIMGGNDAFLGKRVMIFTCRKHV